MKCWKCGADLAPGAAFCNSCGAAQEQGAPYPGQTTHRNTQDSQNKAAEIVAKAAGINHQADDCGEQAHGPQYQQPGPGGGPQYGQTPPPPQGYAPFRPKADRSLIAYILLTFITCGIYGWYFIYVIRSFAHERELTQYKALDGVHAGDGHRNTQDSQNKAATRNEGRNNQK